MQGWTRSGVRSTGPDPGRPEEEPDGCGRSSNGAQLYEGRVRYAKGHFEENVGFRRKCLLICAGSARSCTLLHNACSRSVDGWPKSSESCWQLFGLPIEGGQLRVQPPHVGSGSSHWAARHDPFSPSHTLTDGQAPAPKKGNHHSVLQVLGVWEAVCKPHVHFPSGGRW